MTGSPRTSRPISHDRRIRYEKRGLWMVLTRIFRGQLRLPFPSLPSSFPIRDQAGPALRVARAPACFSAQSAAISDICNRSSSMTGKPIKPIRVEFRLTREWNAEMKMHAPFIRNREIWTHDALRGALPHPLPKGVANPLR